ncbi:hypothetical protein I2486_10055 [Cellulophaga sp. E16_2]|uniref:Uncharacterized protein n=1 Tax=Cellulophaga algicola (strain DSM 14237 / IC166 / ACAM 630) TaxID=688270 RepID=E6X3X4_CELAD|nr:MULTISPECIES: hypothetical protein [Cellulophaga]ADV49299.1 hypothetical protein Celal_2002 [Cellulophaga algicola DSM 14237]MBO0591750.1 hypothetical protein [Cellulophaga sp. E16_2]
MKLSTLFTVGLLFLGINAAIARVGIPIPYGDEDKIIKILDLPDTEEFQLEDGTYFDIGKMYTISHIVWLPYSNTEVVITGYVDDDTYVELTPEQLIEIAALAKVEIPETASASFFDRIGGKIVLGLLALVVLYGIYASYFKKDTE